MNGYLLDTHAWIWAQTAEPGRFSAEMRKQLEKSQAQRRLYLSAISILEVARLVSLGQQFLPTSVDDFVAAGLGDDGLVLLEMTPRILIDSTRLPGELHRDPADRILVATARAHGLTLVTRDKQLLAYSKQSHLNARKP